MTCGAFLTGFDDVQALFNARGAGRALLRGVARRGESHPAARGRLLATAKVLQTGTAVQKWNTAAQWQLAERRLLGLPPVRLGVRPQQVAALRKYQLQAHYLVRRCGLGKTTLLRAAGRIGGSGLPVTLLHGRTDKVCHPRNAERLQALIPQARLVWVPAGHLVNGEMARALRAAIRASAWSVGTGDVPGFVDLPVDGIA